MPQMQSGHNVPGQIPPRRDLPLDISAKVREDDDIGGGAFINQPQVLRAS
jgi:hypothetical protein